MMGTAFAFAHPTLIEDARFQGVVKAICYSISPNENVLLFEVVGLKICGPTKNRTPLSWLLTELLQHDIL